MPHKGLETIALANNHSENLKIHRASGKVLRRVCLINGEKLALGCMLLWSYLTNNKLNNKLQMDQYFPSNLNVS